MGLSLSILRKLADSDAHDSLANTLRDRRFQQFEKLIASLPRPLRILDVGGTNAFWAHRGWAGRREFQIVTLNLEAEEQRYDNIRPIAGDATDLGQFDDRSFDVVFSNSVIEHLFTFENQGRMASEVRRVGKAFCIQTPNFWFPIEPHFHVPGWQWMPGNFRVAIIRRWRCGWRGPCADLVKARALVEEIRLLDERELRAIFPGAMLLPERFCGFIKSWTVIGGFVSSKPVAHIQ